MDVAAFWMAVAILVYGALLKFQPSLARGWLCICGAAAGGFLAFLTGFFVTRLFTSGWSGLAITFWVGLVLLHLGAIAGFQAKAKAPAPAMTAIPTSPRMIRFNLT